MRAYSLFQQKAILSRFSLKYNKFSSTCNKYFSASEIDAKKFEQEWNQIYEQKAKAKKEYIENELNEYQKKEVKVFYQKFKNLNKEEKKLFLLLVKQKSILMTGTNPMDTNINIPGSSIEMENIWPKENANWAKTENMKAALASFSGSAIPQAAPVALDTDEKKVSDKPAVEKKIEKSQYDVKLTSFDAAKKIALIKEVRAWLTLGLKEAKELVEKAPTELKKGVSKEDAEQIKKKLSENGGVIELI